ncbi:bifunctional DNA primase/polymerase [Streptomyces aidingensis]|uniref:bifunctional DNA primase/polymerase n=1 Tax=Streptomyces aidingensis TaxID=910347 RepID=UPI001FEA3205|nr:bifunctional DNA primase/polymerase [Streptomyces aidingensis]
MPGESALICASRWHWPVVPGAGFLPNGNCRCGRLDCSPPGAHPHDPGLLAATTDTRMVGWWWDRRPQAPVLLATGGAVCAISLPAASAMRAVTELDRRGRRTGPVLAADGRIAMLVAPYERPELGELLCALMTRGAAPGRRRRGSARGIPGEPGEPGERERPDEAAAEPPEPAGAAGGPPAGLRFHGPGGYLPLPPAPGHGTGPVHWLRPPRPRPVWLPRAADLLDVLVAADRTTPGTGTGTGTGTRLG